MADNVWLRTANSPASELANGWRRRAARVALPVAALVLLACVLHVVVTMLAAAQSARDIRGGFGFLWQPTGFRLSESLFEVAPEDPAWLTILAGFVNTLTVSACAIPLAGALGLVLGLLRLVRHPMISRLAAAIVVPIRNTPVLLQMFVWYGAFLALPNVRQAWQPVPGVLLSNRGAVLPLVVDGLPYGLVVTAALGLAAWGWRRIGRRHAVIVLLFAIAAGSVALHLAGYPLPHLELPVVRGFGVQGGLTLNPERMALICSLVLFHAAYVADIVEGATLGVSAAQWQAGLALGLTPVQTAREVVFPHAARAALPPFVNQCVMLIKNTTLAVAIGYPDLMGVLGSVTSQSAAALECLLLAATAYLLLGYGIGALTDRYNRRVSAQQLDNRDGRTLAGVWGRAEVTRAGLVGSAGSAVLTLFSVALLGWLGWEGMRWAVIDAVWQGTTQQCEAAAGACWLAVRENAPLLIFGTLDASLRVTAAIGSLALLAGVAPWLCGVRQMRVCAGFAAVGGMVAIVMLAPIPTVYWSGAMASIVLAVTAIAAALPLSLGLALMRRSGSIVMHRVAVSIIDGVRGVPLITQLMLVTLLVPFMVGGDWSSHKFELAWMALTLHTACMMAEVLRGGFQSISGGQALAGQALGLTRSQVLWHVTLPQVVRRSVAPAVGVIVGAIKDTSLVSVIGLFDVMSAAKAVLADGTWRPYFAEIYVAVALAYGTFCLALSWRARRLTYRQ
ncbi:MAG: ABC transporter permease subunit [Pandoraea sp.]|nr:ABC transporter permease subunit [Pandoraea sp.]MDR3398395.1 ABC transporter permease subunit [Pandoraea sp.]